MKSRYRQSPLDEEEIFKALAEGGLDAASEKANELFTGMKPFERLPLGEVLEAYVKATIERMEANLHTIESLGAVNKEASDEMWSQIYAALPECKDRPLSCVKMSDGGYAIFVRHDREGTTHNERVRTYLESLKSEGVDISTIKRVLEEE